MWEYVITVTPRQRDVAHCVRGRGGGDGKRRERSGRQRRETSKEGDKRQSRGNDDERVARARGRVCVRLINQTLAFGILAREKEERSWKLQERRSVGKRGKEGSGDWGERGKGKRRRGRGGRRRGAVGQAGSSTRPSRAKPNRAESRRFASLRFEPGSEFCVSRFFLPFLSLTPSSSYLSFPLISLYPFNNSSLFLTLSFIFALNPFSRIPLHRHTSSALFPAWLPCIGESTTHQLADRRPLKAQNH